MSAAPQLMKVLKLSIEVVRGPNRGESFTFEKSLVKIGRGPENDITFGLDVKVSREHLELQVSPTQVVVKNLSQKNPMAVDGEETNEAILRPGASVRFGETEMKVLFENPIDTRPALAPVQFNVNPAASAQKSLQAPVRLEDRQITPSIADSPPPPLAVVSNSPQSPAVAGYNQPAAARGGPAAPWTPPPPNRVAKGHAKNDAYQASSYQAANASSSKFRFYVIVGAVILGIAYFFTQEQIKKKAQLRLKDSTSTEIAINESQNEYDKTLKEIEKKGQDTIQYKTSQEQYLRGFRDYRQGQFVRAMEEFQAALSFYPSHEMARKYYTLSKRKFDEQVQFNMIQGKRYYGVSNYRLCMGYYSTVIKMKKDERDPVRREALQYYNECELKIRGKY